MGSGRGLLTVMPGPTSRLFLLLAGDLLSAPYNALCPWRRKASTKLERWVVEESSFSSDQKDAVRKNSPWGHDLVVHCVGVFSPCWESRQEWGSARPQERKEMFSFPLGRRRRGSGVGTGLAGYVAPCASRRTAKPSARSQSRRK